MLALDMLRGAAGAQPTLDLNFTSGTLDSRVTYTGASLATLTDATGAIAYKPHNLLTYSEAFDNAAWSKAAATVTANVGVAPDGTTSADLIVPTAVSAVHYVRQAPALSNSTTYTWSVYAKASGYSIIAIEAYSGTAFNYANVNVTTGAVGTVTGGLVVSTPVLVNGMCRFSVTMTTAATGVPKFTAIICAADATYTFTGDGTSGVYLYGAQLNVGPLQPYYPTTSAAYYGPRFTYDPVTHAALGLLIEEQRTNLLTYSEQFDNAAWPLSGSTVTANATTGPDGNATADKLVESVGAGAHLLNRAGATVSLASVMSVYAKAAERTQIALQLGADVGYYNLSTGAVISGANASIVSVGNGWYRCILTGTPVNTNSLIYLASGGAASYTGDGTSGVYIWGAQLEAGSFATSYIPTTSASVTRAADSATMTGSNFSSWFNATQGAFVVDVVQTTKITTLSKNWLSANDASLANRIQVSSNAAADVNFTSVSASATQASITGANLPAGSHKIAARYAANDFALVVNGTVSGTDVAGIVSAGVTQLNIGTRDAGQDPINNCISRLRYYNTALTNAQLQALTT